MEQIVLIGIGGFFGAISRFVISKTTSSVWGSFPLGTLLVNVIGSFILGFLYYSAMESKMISPELRSFIGVGFIGAFTTMSTFSYESFRFLEQGNTYLFGLNFVSNTLFCLFAIYIGRVLSLLLFKRV